MKKIHPLWSFIAMACVWSAVWAADDLVVNNNRVRQVLPTDMATVSINGDGCNITINGQCDTLNVRGKKNHVTIVGPVINIDVPGKNNQLTFQGGFTHCIVGGVENNFNITGTPAGSKPPKIELSGSGDIFTWHSSNAVLPDFVDNGTHNKLKKVP